MMKWCIPSKTFLIGEYIAMAGEAALLLTTTPHFELQLTTQPGLQGIHPASPAAQWWALQPALSHGLQWTDPYQGLGGMGASSAQFVGVYQAYMHLTQQPSCHEALFKAYQQVAYTGVGLAPSGYDVLAQAHQGCVSIHRNPSFLHTSPWPFEDIGFILIHTGQKLATHEHLKQLSTLSTMAPLKAIAETAIQAFETKNSPRFTTAINAYHQMLEAQRCVAPHTHTYLQHLQAHCHPLALKGCGAMGADVILMIVATEAYSSTLLQLKNFQAHVLATHHQLYWAQ